MAKINRWLAVLAAVLGAAAWTQPSVAGSDLWWHLAAGREIWNAAAVPTTDSFSFTFAGRPWMHHEWLWGVGYWLLYRVEPQLVAWANLALLVAIFALAFAVARRHCGSSFGASVALWGAAATAHWFFDIRPHELTLLFLAIFLWTREQRFAPWLWPLLMVPWANLHGGFVFGFGAIGLFALVQTLQRSSAARRLVVDRRLWLGVALSGLAFLCNPWGWRILEYPAAYLDSSSPYRDILEWHPPGLHLDPRGFAGRFGWLLVAAAGGALLELRARRRDPYLLALSAVTCAMALTSRRFIPLFALCSLPLVARLATELRDRALAALGTRGAQRAHSAAPLVALALALLMWRDVRLVPGLLERWTESHLYPRAALRYLQALAPGPRLLNHYNWGGYVMLHAPEFKLFIDGRANTVYDDATYLDYVALVGGGDGTAARMAKYPFDAAFIPSSSGGLARRLARPDLGWRLVYRDSLAAILLPPGSPRLRQALPRVEEILRDDPELLLARGEAAAEGGRIRDGRELIEQALRLEPLWVRGYGALAQTYVLERDARGIARAIERGIAVEPRSAPTLRLLQSVALGRLGEKRAELRALERAVPRGPFSRPESLEQQIAALRAQLAAR